jgi:hypothetical protein
MDDDTGVRIDSVSEAEAWRAAISSLLDVHVSVCWIVNRNGTWQVMFQGDIGEEGFEDWMETSLEHLNICVPIKMAFSQKDESWEKFDSSDRPKL